jgi:hypothetical protein
VTEPDVAVCIASLNTASSTELTIRSLRAHEAGHDYRLVVGDCGSVDRTLPVLMRLLRAGLLDDLELIPHGRKHAEWIDHWIASATTPYLMLIDSDVEVRGPGWLSTPYALLREQGAAVAMANLDPDDLDYRDLRTGEVKPLRRRPSMHFLLLDVQKCRTVNRSFLERSDADWNYDVGAWFFAGLTEAGLRYVVMPDDWWLVVRHWGSLSWGKSVGGAMRREWILNNVKVAVHLAAYRRLGPQAAKSINLFRDTRQSLRQVFRAVSS